MLLGTGACSGSIQLGCSGCHRPALTTGPDETPALSDHAIDPYTDLLLHDIGAGLADDQPASAAPGSEWHTAPLWGFSLAPTVNGDMALLHDGRARAVEEAIL